MHVLVGEKQKDQLIFLWLNEGLAEYANRDKTVSYDLYIVGRLVQINSYEPTRSFPEIKANLSCLWTI